MGQQIDTTNQMNADQTVFTPGFDYKNITRTFIVVSALSSTLFIILSYLTSELGYYLLAGSSLITLIFSIGARVLFTCRQFTHYAHFFHCSVT